MGDWSIFWWTGQLGPILNLVGEIPVNWQYIIASASDLILSLKLEINLNKFI
jgi:hypothetical protein